MRVWVKPQRAADASARQDNTVTAALESSCCCGDSPAMCGRFSQTKPWRELSERFSASMPTTADEAPRYNIAPTQMVIVVSDDGQRQMRAMKWGLIPSWAKDAAIGNRMINARAETIAEKPSFRTALRKRRCIIPADGFYEWQKQAGGKQPMRIVLKSGEVFGFAGLWDSWKSPGGEVIYSCTIITTAANELLKTVHDRMPVILTPEAETAWLDPSVQDATLLLPLLKQYPADQMEFYPVSKIVNTPTNDRAECVQAITPVV